MKNTKTQPGTKRADSRFRVVVTQDGPYAVYGNPPLSQQFITKDSDNFSWTFEQGDIYPMKDECVYLCRCGESKNKPYCDGAHATADWDPTLTAPERPLLDDAETFDGPTLQLTDNESYCVFARFCDGKGRVWNLVGESDDPQKRDYTIYEANMCPGGRLSAWDKKTGEPFEPHYDPSLALIQDRPQAISAGLWIRGGIPVEREDGYVYEIRNRQVVCRCGQSSNKPWCDGTHASMKFRDGLPMAPKK